jgi:hypothetical protein
MMLALAWLRSRHLPALAAVCAVVAIAGAFAADATLRLPVVRRALPLPVLMVLIPALVATTPLCSRFDALEASLPRGVSDRAMAGGAACALALLACLPVGLAAGPIFPWSALLALMAVGVAAVIVLGPLAWMPTIVLGLGTVYVDFVYAEPIRSALDSVGIAALAATLGASLLAYVIVGPQRS